MIPAEVNAAYADDAHTGTELSLFETVLDDSIPRIPLSITAADAPFMASSGLNFSLPFSVEPLIIPSS